MMKFSTWELWIKNYVLRQQNVAIGRNQKIVESGHIYHATISNAKKLHARTIVQGMDQIILRSDN